MLSAKRFNKVIVVLAYIFLLFFIISIFEITKNSQESDFEYDVETQHNDLKRAINSYSSISDILNDILLKYNAKTVLLYRLHKENYGIDLHGGLLVSVANIKTSSDSHIDAMDVMNIPAQTFSFIFPQLLNGSNVDIRTNILPSGAFQELLNKEHSVESEWVPLLDAKQQLIGILNVNWDVKGNIPKGESYYQMIRYLRDKNTAISNYFSLPHVPDNTDQER